VGDAVQLYEVGRSVLRSSSEGEDEGDLTPLGLIASGFVCGQLLAAASDLFIKSSPASSPSSPSSDVPVAFAGHHDDEAGARTPIKEDDEEKEEGWRLSEVVELGRGLTRRVQRLTDLWEDVSASASFPLSHSSSSCLDNGADDEDDEADDKEDVLSETKLLLEAISLYHRIASSHPRSPSTASWSPSPSPSPRSLDLFIDLDPPSLSASPYTSPPSSSSGSSTPTDVPRGLRLDENALKGAVARLALKRMLASTAFDREVGIDDARDRMVDWLSVA